MYFLRNKGTEVADWGWPPDRVAVEGRFYRLVSSQGVLRDVGGEVRPPVGVDDQFRGGTMDPVTDLCDDFE